MILKKLLFVIVTTFSGCANRRIDPPLTTEETWEAYGIGLGLLAFFSFLAWFVGVFKRQI